MPNRILLMAINPKLQRLKTHEAILKKRFDVEIFQPFTEEFRPRIVSTFTRYLVSTLKAELIPLSAYDIVHFYNIPDILGIPLYQRGIRYVYDIRSTWDKIRYYYDFPLINFFADFAVTLERKLARKSVKVIVVNKLLKERVKKHGINERKIEIVPNGIDVKNFKKLAKRGYCRKKFGIEKDKFVVTYIGNLSKVEGVDILIESIPFVVKKIKSVIFLIVGDGRLKSWAQRRVKELNVEKYVIFTGRVPHEEIPSIILDLSLIHI